MKRKYVFSLAAAAIASGALAVATAHAHGFGHHGHHGSAAVKACIVAMTPQQREELKGIFSTAKTGLINDHKTVKTDKENLALAILSGDNATALVPLEKTLSADEATLKAAEDGVAVQICGMLSTTPGGQLAKAKTLYTDLQALRESTHATARADFQAARP